MYSPEKGTSGFKRILNAWGYSLAGIKAAYQNEAAFRQIVWICVILIPLSFVLPVSAVERAIMIFVCLFSMIVELLNSAIENVVDRISLERHELSKRAKDMGSAAQMIALSIIFLTWAVILVDKFL